MTEKRCIMNLLRSPRLAWGVLAAAVLIGAAAALHLFSADTPQPDERLTAAARGLPQYDVTLKLLPETREVSLSETILFRNGTGDPLDRIMLRTWLNAFRREETSPAAAGEMYDACYPEGFSPGYLTVHDVLWNRSRAAWRYANGDETAMEITVPSLQPGEEGTLTIRCVARIPECAHRTGGLNGDFQLGNVIPSLALYQNHAWRTDEYSAVGDPFLGDCANYTVHLSMPEGYTAACSAKLAKGGDGLWHGSVPAARDVALCLSRDYRVSSARNGGTLVEAFAKTQDGARRAAEDARKAVETFSALYGACPWPYLAVCSVDFPFGGMEYTGLVMIGQGNFLDSKKDTLELTVAHETAHQWFYALVGSDQVNDPWQDEALCQYAMLRYVAKRYGQGSFETLKYYQVDAPMAEAIPGSLTPGSPIDYFGSLADYSSVVYGRGAALLLALDEWLPDGTDAFLRDYVSRFAFRFATRQDFESLLSDRAGKDCAPLLLDYLDTAH